MNTSTDMLNLLEKVLSGRPGDIVKHSSSYSELHEYLLAASPAELRAAYQTVTEMQKKSLPLDTSKKFLHYLKLLIKGKTPAPPNLSYLTFSSNPACQNSAKLFYAMNTIYSKRKIILKKTFEDLKDYKTKNNRIFNNYDLQVQRLKFANLVANLKKGLQINLKTSFCEWEQKIQTQKNKLKKVLEKAKLRYFYKKYISFERWENECWNQQEIIDEYWEDEEFYKKLLKKRENNGLNSSDSQIKDMFDSMTGRSKLMNKVSIDNRMSLLASSVLHLNDSRSKLEAIVKRLVVINKLRKNIPYKIISRWNDKICKNNAKIKKLTDWAASLTAIIEDRYSFGFLSLKDFYYNSDLEEKRTVFHNLVRNSVFLEITPKILLQQLKSSKKPFSQPKKLKLSLLNLNKFALKRIQEPAESWKKFIKACKDKKLIQANKCLKIEKLFQSLTNKKLKESVSRIKNSEKKTKSALNKIYITMKRKPKQVFDFWRFTAEKMNKTLLLSVVRSSGLQNSLKNILLRPLNSVYKDLTTKKEKKNVVEKILKKLCVCLPERVKAYFLHWRTINENYNNDLLYSCIKAQQLANSLKNLHLRTLNNATQRILNGQNKIKKALEALSKSIEKYKCSAFFRWSIATKKASQKLLFDEYKAGKLGNSLKKILNRTTSSNFSKIIRFNDRVKKTIRWISIIFLKGLEKSFNSWKFREKTIFSIKEDAFATEKIIKKKEDTYFNDEKQTNPSDMSFKSLKLKNSIENSATKAFLSGKLSQDHHLTKLKLILTKLKNCLYKTPKKVLKTWKATVYDLNKNKVLLTVRTHKFNCIFQRMLRKMLKNVEQSIFSVLVLKIKFKLCLKTLDKISGKITKARFDVWKEFASSTKNQKIIQDYLRIIINHTV